MPRYHLTIVIYNQFFENKLNARGKIDSVYFEDYDYFFEKILADMTMSEINSMKLKLFECYKYSLTRLKCCQILEGEVYNGYLIPSSLFDVSTDIIARCIPRGIRNKYFDYDVLKEKYYIKSDFIYYLKG